MKIDYNNLYTHFVFTVFERPRAVNSERFIIDNRLSSFPFHWQQSASAFSVSKSHVDKVCKYILNQPEHHKKYSFAEEYENILKFYEKSIKDKVNKVDDVP